jgi:hypothetical protein
MPDINDGKAWSEWMLPTWQATSSRAPTWRRLVRSFAAAAPMTTSRTRRSSLRSNGGHDAPVAKGAVPVHARASCGTIGSLWADCAPPIVSAHPFRAALRCGFLDSSQLSSQYQPSLGSGNEAIPIPLVMFRLR